MSDRDRRRVVVKKTTIGDPTFLLQFSLESHEETEIPLRINFKIKANKDNPELNRTIERTFPVNQDIRIMCSYSGSLKQVNIPGIACFSLLNQNKMTIDSETEIHYDNLKKVPATTFSLAKKQTVNFHFLDGNEADGNDKVFLRYNTKRKKKKDNGLTTGDICISSDPTNNWIIKEVNFKEQVEDKIKRYWIKNNREYLTVIDDKSLKMTKNRSQASMWVCQEARTERFGQEISIFAIKHHVTNTYLLCDTKTGVVFLQKHSLPVFPWYLHSLNTNRK